MLDGGVVGQTVCRGEVGVEVHRAIVEEPAAKGAAAIVEGAMVRQERLSRCRLAG